MILEWTHIVAYRIRYISRKVYFASILPKKYAGTQEILNRLAGRAAAQPYPLMASLRSAHNTKFPVFKIPIWIKIETFLPTLTAGPWNTASSLPKFNFFCLLHLDFPILMISNPFNSNSNYFFSPHLDFPFLMISNSFNSNSIFFVTRQLDFTILLVSHPFNSNFFSHHAMISSFQPIPTIFLENMAFLPIFLFEFKFDYPNYLIQSNRGSAWARIFWLGLGWARIEKPSPVYGLSQMGPI